MSLTNLQVFSRERYSMMTEILTENIALFNAATQNGIVMRQATKDENQGSFNTSTFWKKATTVRRRNANTTTAIGTLAMVMDQAATVKVAAGTPQLIYTPGNMDWIAQQKEAEKFAAAEQLAQEMFSDMLSAGIKAALAALGQATTYTDISALAADAGKFNPQTASDATFKLGDQMSRLKCWLVNPLSYQQFINYGLTNTAKLFTWGNVNVTQDVQGRPIVISDLVPIIVGSPNKYQCLGLVDSGITLEANDDYSDADEVITGFEQIRYAFQAQWSFNLGIKGYTWDKTNGGSSPTDAALATATNWDQKATNVKDLAGLVIRTAI